MIYSEDLHRYIYNMIPIIERFNLGNVNTFFNNLYKKDINNIILIQKYFKKYRIDDEYTNDAGLNKYKTNHYNPNIDYNDWNDAMMHRYYMAKYEDEYLLPYPEFLTNKAIYDFEKKNKANQWILDNLNLDPVKRSRRDIYNFFKENNITTHELMIAGW